VRGVLSVEILYAIEQLLRERTGRPDLRLCDWCDLIAGTSVGAITAAMLAIGYSASDIRQFYQQEADLLFQPAGLWTRRRYFYDARKLSTKLRELLGSETTLGSDRLRTLVLLVMRNTTTDSPWFVTNNPAAKFNHRSQPACNLDVPLWQLVRASTAAPVYFEPEVIALGGETFLFSDGGVTGYNNPAFKAFLVATVDRYGLGWRAGVERMLVVSVGTGAVNLANPALQQGDINLLYNLQNLPLALLSSAAHQQDVLSRVFGDCLVGESLDLELGDLMGGRGPVDPRLFTYLRYDVGLTHDGLAAIGCGHLDPHRLSALDAVANLSDLQQIGRSLAAARVRPEHFDRFLAPRGDDSSTMRPLPA